MSRPTQEEWDKKVAEVRQYHDFVDRMHPDLMNTQGHAAVLSARADPKVRALYDLTSAQEQTPAQTAASPSRSSSPSSWSGGGLPSIPSFDQAKAQWETIKADFAERVAAISAEMTGQGRDAWAQARGHVSSGLRTPERDTDYLARRPDVAEHSSAGIYLRDHPDVAQAVAAGAFPSALEHQRRFGQAEGRHWPDPAPADAWEHYRAHGRIEGTPYINPEQPRGYGL